MSMSENLNLKKLESQVKTDPDGYISEVTLLYNQFKSSFELFQQQSAMSFTSLSGTISSDSSVSKSLMELVHFLARVTPFYYKKELAGFPNELVMFLELDKLRLDVRMCVAKAVVHLVNKKVVDIAETLVAFMKLMTEGGQVKKLASSIVISSMKSMFQKHKYDPRIKDIQNVLFRMLQEEDEVMARHSLTIISDLHRRKIWVDGRTAEAICLACLHPSSKIMIAALSFLLNLEKAEDDDSDDSGSEDDHVVTQSSQTLLSKEAVYKASHKGTVSSKKKKKAKLQRVARSIKKQQRLSSENNNSSNYSPLNHLKDAQGFAEKLFSRLKACKVFKTKVMMYKVIARTVSLHRLVLLDFHKSMIEYIKTGERFVTEILATAVQASHDMVPLDEVQPLFTEVLNEFVHINARPEVLSVGLNFVREMCLRMPLLMTGDLLQELVLYRKSNDKAISSAGRSLLTLFREVCPSLLIKKDRGRHADVKARPKSFGEVDVATNIPGLDDDVSSDEESDNQDEDNTSLSDAEERDLTSLNAILTDEEYGTTAGESDGDSEPNSGDTAHGMDVLDVEVSDEDVNYDSNDEAGVIGHQNEIEDNSGKNLVEESYVQTPDDSSYKSRAKKRKFSNVDNKSIRALKKDARASLKKHGDIVSTSDKLITKKFDAAKLEATYMNTKMTKEEKEALIRAARAETGKYQARSALKKKKTGGLSNRQKEHSKHIPLAAKRMKIVKTRTKKLKKLSVKKQFRGRKAWK